MSVILRITDIFEIKDRGKVYLAKDETYPSNIYTGMILYDLLGYRFKVIGREMFRRFLLNIKPEDLPVGVMIKNLDGEDVHGWILQDEPCVPNFLYCCHPLYRRQVDEDYEDEYRAAEPFFNRALFSYEDIVDGKLSLYGDTITRITIYRGWMLRPEQYQMLYQKLKEQGIILVNSPEEYNKYHLLPGWYRDFEADTAPSVWTEGADIDALLQKADTLQGTAAIIKDYVKSRKHEWYQACYIENLTDRNKARKIIETFTERQGDDLNGGLVLRSFLELKPAGFHEKSGIPVAEEYRVFVFAGRVLIIAPYWTNEVDVFLTETKLDWIRSKIKGLRSSFVTMDIARKVDGDLVIVEFGDGQVSGLQTIEPENFYRLLNDNSWRHTDGKNMDENQE